MASYVIKADATIKMDFGVPSFSFSAEDPIDLIVLIMALFIKIRWLLSGQSELEIFKENYKDMIDDYPQSINGISKIFRINMDLNGTNPMKVRISKYGTISFTSKFPLHYSNVSIMNISMIFIDKVYQIIGEDSKKIMGDILVDIKELILDNNEDTSISRMFTLYHSLVDLISEKKSD
ncbi:MAG: hypothetical protein Q8O09_05485 [Bacillota bacterium]|nr:hypothetical protein [Bacillota bacterium]